MMSHDVQTPCRWLRYMAALFWLMLIMHPARSSGLCQADEIVRREAARILSSREFRNFPRLDHQNPLAGQSPGQYGQPGDSNSDGGSGGSAGNGDGGASAENLGGDQAEDSADAGREADRGTSGGSSWWPRFGSGAFSAIASLAGPVMTFLSWFVIAAVVILLLVLVVQAIRDRTPASRRTSALMSVPEAVESVVPAVAPGETDPRRLVERAAELAAEGRYREALHQLVLAAMSSSERAGLVQFRRGLTLHDYLRALSRRSPAACHALTRMTHVFEPVYYGQQAASREMVEQALNNYTTGFQSLETPG